MSLVLWGVNETDNTYAEIILHETGARTKLPQSNIEFSPDGNRFFIPLNDIDWYDKSTISIYRIQDEGAVVHEPVNVAPATKWEHTDIKWVSPTRIEYKRLSYPLRKNLGAGALVFRDDGWGIDPSAGAALPDNNE